MYKIKTEKVTPTFTAAALAIILGAVILSTTLLSGCAASSGSKSDLKVSAPPFVNDTEVIGTWTAVDIVTAPGNFIPGQQLYKGERDLPLFELIFADNGVMNLPDCVWTKGIVSSSYYGKNFEYTIQTNGSEKYIFLQKSENTYVVYKWASSSTTIENQSDNLDLPFTNDPAVIGAWDSVGFVKSVSDFDPASTSWPSGLYLEELIFSKKGALKGTTSDGPLPSELSWTKGVVLNPYFKTASTYVIKELDGKTYLFLEWKTGDYVNRHEMPGYYVLKKSA